MEPSEDIGNVSSQERSSGPFATRDSSSTLRPVSGCDWLASCQKMSQSQKKGGPGEGKSGFMSEEDEKEAEEEEDEVERSLTEEIAAREVERQQQMGDEARQEAELEEPVQRQADLEAELVQVSTSNIIMCPYSPC